MNEPEGEHYALADLPSAYNEWRASTLGRVTDAIERKLILDLLGDVRGRTVLDVGCGDGDLAIELWRRGAKVTGIDASVRMIEAARERAARHGAEIAFDMGTAQSLPFAPESFDRVVTITLLCFVEDGTSVLREMARVLRPRGRLIIGELGKRSMWAALRRMRGRRGHPVWRQARFRTAGELRHLAEEAGLRVDALRGAIYYPPCGLAARLLAPVDRPLGRLTTFGAAFLALSATKPP
ncbi:MAG: class I SAM-dependent methyltransferase [Alphaproteobacteria bacterium]